MSKTPHASPPQKMARKSLEVVEVEGMRSVPFPLRLARDIDERWAKSSRIQLRIDHLRLSAKSAAAIHSPSATAPHAAAMSQSASRRLTSAQSLLSARQRSARGREFSSFPPSHA